MRCSKVMWWLLANMLGSQTLALLALYSPSNHLQLLDSLKMRCGVRLGHRPSPVADSHRPPNPVSSWHPDLNPPSKEHKKVVCPLRVTVRQRCCCPLHVGEEMKRSALLLSVQRYVAMAHLLPVRRTQATLLKLWQWCFFQSCYCFSFFFFNIVFLA